MDWIKLESIRTDQQAQFIAKFLKDKGLTLQEYYPEAKFSENKKLLAHSANEIMEKIDEETLCSSASIGR